MNALRQSFIATVLGLIALLSAGIACAQAQPAAPAQQRSEYVLGCQLLMRAAGRQFVRRLEGFLSLDCQLVESHFPTARLSTCGNLTRRAGWAVAPPTRRENGVGQRGGSK